MKPILANFITSHAPRLLLVGIALCCPPLVSSAEQGRPIEQALWEKALADNTKDVIKAHAAYQKALSEASAKVVKSLEACINDLNDPQKMGALGTKDRAAAMKALEGRVTAVKEQGAVAEAVATASHVVVPARVIHGAFVKAGATHIIVLRKDKTFYFSWLNQAGNYTVSGDRVILNGDDKNYFTISKDGKRLNQLGKIVFNFNTEATP